MIKKDFETKFMNKSDPHDPDAEPTKNEVQNFKNKNSNKKV